MLIRSVEPVDHGKVAELIRGGSVQDWAQVVANEANSEHGIVAVENHDSVVGYADCEPSGSLVRVYVRSDRRRQGIGRMLIHELLRRKEVLIFDAYDLIEFDRSVIDFLNACGFVLDVDSREFTLGVNDPTAIIVKASVRVHVLRGAIC